MEISEQLLLQVCEITHWSIGNKVVAEALRVAMAAVNELYKLSKLQKQQQKQDGQPQQQDKQDGAKQEEPTASIAFFRAIVHRLAGTVKAWLKRVLKVYMQALVWIQEKRDHVLGLSDQYELQVCYSIPAYFIVFTY